MSWAPVQGQNGRPTPMYKDETEISEIDASPLSEEFKKALVVLHPKGL
jgi:hypothetical protein